MEYGVPKGGWGWGLECSIQDSHEAMFSTLDDAWWRSAFATEKHIMFYKFYAINIWIKIHAVIHKSSGDKKAPFMALEMAWVCHVSTFMCCYISKTKRCTNKFASFAFLPSWFLHVLQETVSGITCSCLFKAQHPTECCGCQISSTSSPVSLAGPPLGQCSPTVQ